MERYSVWYGRSRFDRGVDMYRTAGVSAEWVTWMLPGGVSLERMSKHGSVRLGNTWAAPWLADDSTLPDDLADELPEPDIGHLLRGGLVLNQRAVSVLGPMLRRSGELLLCHTPSGRRWAYNCTRFADRATPPAVGMFRCNDEPDGLYATEIFVRVLRAAELTGLRFRPAPSARSTSVAA